MNEPNIVILAGGISSRMKKSSPELDGIETELLQQARMKPKAMLGVGAQSRPFLDYLLYSVQQAGYRDLVIVISDRDTAIRTYYEDQGGETNFPSLSFSYAVQKIPHGRTKPLGTADALETALLAKPEWRGKQFTVCNSDNLYSVSVLQTLLMCTDYNALIDYDRSALNFDEHRIAGFAIIKHDESCYLTDIIEKPSREELQSAIGSGRRIGVSMNIFRFSYDSIFPILARVPFHPVRNEKELPEAVRMLAVEEPGSMRTIPVAEHVLDLTSQSDIPLVQAYLHQEFPDFFRT